MFEVGAKCLAKWSDGHYYNGIVQEIISNEPIIYIINFYEYGEQLQIQGDNVKEYDAAAHSRSSSYDDSYNNENSYNDGYYTEEEYDVDLDYNMPAPGNLVRDKTLTKRDRILNEIVSTEQTYVGHLKNLCDQLLQPLRELAQKNEASKEGFTMKDFNQLFSNIETVLNVNETFSNNLTERLSTWSENSCIGDLFVRFGPYFKLYSAYVNNHAEAVKLLHRIEKKQKNKYSNFLQQCSSLELKTNQNLESFLIMPIQRIPRYKLLLEAFIEETDMETHSDAKNLKQALDIVSKVAVHINESIRARQNLDKIASLQNQFQGNHVFVKPGRQFIKQGPLRKVTAKKNKDTLYEFFLFNDLLVYASNSAYGTWSRAFARKKTGSGKFKGMYRLHKAIDIDKSFNIHTLPDEVDDDNDKKRNNRFLIVNSKKSIVVYADTPELRTEWVDLMLEQKVKLENTIQRTNISAKDDDVSNEKVQLPKDAIGLVKCLECDKPYEEGNDLYRCHHCHGIVCQPCSTFRFRRDEADRKGVLQRICNACVKKVKQLMSEERRVSITLLEPAPEETIPADHTPVRAKRAQTLTLNRNSRLAKMAESLHGYTAELATLKPSNINSNNNNNNNRKNNNNSATSEDNDDDNNNNNNNNNKGPPPIPNRPVRKRPMSLFGGPTGRSSSILAEMKFQKQHLKPTNSNIDHNAKIPAHQPHAASIDFSGELEQRLRARTLSGIHTNKTNLLQPSALKSQIRPPIKAKPPKSSSSDDDDKNIFLEHFKKFKQRNTLKKGQIVGVDNQKMSSDDELKVETRPRSNTLKREELEKSIENLSNDNKDSKNIDKQQSLSTSDVTNDDEIKSDENKRTKKIIETISSESVASAEINDKKIQLQATTRTNIASLIELLQNLIQNDECSPNELNETVAKMNDTMDEMKELQS